MNGFPIRVNDTLTSRASEMIQTFQSGYFFAALSLALTIPDICGNKQYPEEKSGATRYAKWFNRYVAHLYRNANEDADVSDCDACYFDGDDCYQLRCVFLHEGTNAPHTERKKTIYHVAQFRVFSTEPGTGTDAIGKIWSDDESVIFNQVDLDLCKFLFGIKSGVEAFVAEFPHMDSFNPIAGSESVFYAPITDFRDSWLCASQ